MDHYNEIDHSVPVAHRLLEKTDRSVAFVLYGGYPADDYRLTLLREFDRATVTHAAHVAGTGTPLQRRTPDVDTARTRSLVESAKEVGRKLPTNIPERVWHTITDTSHPRAYLRDIGTPVFEALAGESGVVVFDWKNVAPDRSPGQKFVADILDAARSRGFGAVALPHGDRSFSNALYRDGQFERLLAEVPLSCGLNLHTTRYEDLAEERRERDVFDAYVVPNEHCAARLRPVIGDIVTVLGSPRYNGEWIEIVADRAPTFESERTAPLKVVFFPRDSTKFLVHPDAARRTLRLLSSYSDVHVVVKTHTRLKPEVISALRDETGADTFRDERVEIVYNDTHSPSLIEWADLVVDMGTSATFGAIQRDTVVAHLEYAHGNESILGTHFPDCAMRCPDDLYQLLCAQLEEPGERNYTEQQRRSFLEDVVTHPDGQNVLDSYVELVERLWGQ